MVARATAPPPRSGTLLRSRSRQRSATTRRRPVGDVASALVVFCAVLGLLIGSFLNVVIWRVPRGESIVRPPSACPRLRARRPASRQRAGALVAAAARTVPRLRASRSRGGTRSSSCCTGVLFAADGAGGPVPRWVLPAVALPGGGRGRAGAHRPRRAAAAGRDRAAVVRRRSSCCWPSPAGTPAGTSDWACAASRGHRRGRAVRRLLRAGPRLSRRAWASAT